jgi:hypothetical protein
MNRRALERIAVLNYAYPTNFLTALPPHPIKTACYAVQSQMQDKVSSYATVRALAAAVKVYFSDPRCMNTSAPPYYFSDSSTYWRVLYCNGVESSLWADNGETDMFYPPNNFTQEGHKQKCQEEFGIRADQDWQFDSFGGDDPHRYFQWASNIIFSSGKLDPLAIGGVVD